VKWKGYESDHNSYVPLQNVAPTGHVDQFYRRLKYKHLELGMPGIALLRYDIPGGKNEKGTMLVDMRQETVCLNAKNRSLDQQNDYSIVKEGSYLLVFFEHVGKWIKCKVMSSFLLIHASICDWFSSFII
jgi:hypothetical protein